MTKFIFLFVTLCLISVNAYSNGEGYGSFSHIFTLFLMFYVVPFFSLLFILFFIIKFITHILFSPKKTQKPQKNEKDAQKIAFELKKDNPDISTLDIIEELTERGFFSKNGEPFTKEEIESWFKAIMGKKISLIVLCLYLLFICVVAGGVIPFIFVPILTLLIIVVAISIFSPKKAQTKMSAQKIAVELKKDNPDISTLDIIEELTERGFFSKNGEPFTKEEIHAWFKDK